MSYTPTTDFIALLRNTSNGERVLSVPGLDFVVAAMARANMFLLWVGQTAPTLNQATTVWIKPTVGASFAQESVVYLYNAGVSQYQPATPALWSTLIAVLAASSYVFQSVAAGGPVVVGNLVTLAAVQRAAPSVTLLQLPSVGVRNGRTLRVSDWSTAVTAHEIDLTAAAGETVMQDATFKLFSTADQLAGVTLYPSVDLAGWTIP